MMLAFKQSHFIITFVQSSTPSLSIVRNVNLKDEMPLAETDYVRFTKKIYARFD
jgi:hypothetical protein